MLAVAEREQLPVAQARAGEPAAWDILFKRYQLPLYVYVFELVHDEQTSLDIVQETFIAAARHIGGLRDDEKFGSWLFGIAHQKCIQRWRKQNRDEVLHEESSPGQNFLAEVCKAWEASTEAAEQKGIRVVHLRIGLVLSGAGGALAKMALPFYFGAGGTIGSGQQYVSWISIDDMVGIIHHAVMTETLRGAVNAVTPYPVTNSEMTKVLGLVLHRPTLLPVPAFALRLALGREMADDLLLSSTRIEPRQLVATQYPFRHLYLGDALRHVLGRPQAEG